VRIVGGEAGGRPLRVPKGDRVRPTPDRVRETLYNWLADHVFGARVLDLFAGSGALGLEAASRGAAAVTLVESDRAALVALEANREAVDDHGRCRVVRGSAWGFLKRASDGPWDVVLLDPPYGGGRAGRAAQALSEAGLLAPGARVYVETGTQEEAPAVPADWRELRAGSAGDVAFRLYAAAIEPEEDT
jgi:16S rRNA (guanine966-N2)-methyltransferase